MESLLGEPFAEEELSASLHPEQPDLILELDDVDLSSFETDDFLADAVEAVEVMEAVEAVGDRPSSDSSQPSDSAQDWEVLQDSSSDDSLIDAFLHDDTSVTAAAQPSDDLLMELPEADLLADPEAPIETLAADASLFVSELEATPAADLSAPIPASSDLSDPWNEEFEEFTQPHDLLQPSHDSDLDDFFDSFSGAAVNQRRLQDEAEADLFADPFADAPAQARTSQPATAPEVPTPEAEPVDLQPLEETALPSFEPEEIFEAPDATDAPTPIGVTEELFVEGFIVDLSEDEDEPVSESLDFVEGLNSGSADFVEGFVFDSFDAEAAEPEEFDGLFEPEMNVSEESELDLTASLTYQEDSDDDLEGLFGEDEAIAPSSPDLLNDDADFDSLFEPDITESLEPASLTLSSQDNTFSNLFGEADDEAVSSNLSASDSLEMDESLFDSAEESLEPEGFSENLLDVVGPDTLELDSPDAADLDFNLDEDPEDLGFDLDAETASDDLDFNLTEDTEGLRLDLDAEAADDLGFNLDESTSELNFNLDAEADDLDFNLDAEITESLEASESLDEAMLGFDADAVEAQEQDFSAMFTEASEQDLESETPATQEVLDEDAFSFDGLDVGEDADILSQEAFDFDLFGTDEELNEDAIALSDPTDASAADSIEIGNLSFGSETDLEEIAGAPETSELTEAGILSESVFDLTDAGDTETDLAEASLTEAEDFADLDALLGEGELEAIAPDAEPEVAESNDFADLDVLLETSSEPAVTASPQPDDFADLDALLEDQALIRSLPSILRPPYPQRRQTTLQI
ncbi:MAG: hypothetical protein HC840_30950 [Leptolyngbyaceae cyanobacterium RM2_2_4]|nr:hypothetical protein [Leptolyngbyaceae cyanobacterium RM2_2_4]